eukprot:TRINITY_DN2880_c0_g5_i1.p1 TRINITY_DN2880_c0_g5~~TRINITY_DN2880_c0_g5_i1.p1  ORF type:complete len:1022 (+),score=261.20 TRINITY_DN2880_c0_g5_i1:48-3113(+)
MEPINPNRLKESIEELKDIYKILPKFKKLDVKNEDSLNINREKCWIPYFNNPNNDVEKLIAAIDKYTLNYRYFMEILVLYPATEDKIGKELFNFSQGMNAVRTQFKYLFDFCYALNMNQGIICSLLKFFEVFVMSFSSSPSNETILSQREANWTIEQIHQMSLINRLEMEKTGRLYFDILLLVINDHFKMVSTTCAIICCISIVRRLQSPEYLNKLYTKLTTLQRDAKICNSAMLKQVHVQLTKTILEIVKKVRSSIGDQQRVERCQDPSLTAILFDVTPFNNIVKLYEEEKKNMQSNEIKVFLNNFGGKFNKVGQMNLVQDFLMPFLNPSMTNIPFREIFVDTLILNLKMDHSDIMTLESETFADCYSTTTTKVPFDPKIELPTNETRKEILISSLEIISDLRDQLILEGHKDMYLKCVLTILRHIVVEPKLRALVFQRMGKQLEEKKHFSFEDSLFKVWNTIEFMDFLPLFYQLDVMRLSRIQTQTQTQSSVHNDYDYKLVIFVRTALKKSVDFEQILEFLRFVPNIPTGLLLYFFNEFLFNHNLQDFRRLLEIVKVKPILFEKLWNMILWSLLKIDYHTYNIIIEELRNFFQNCGFMFKRQQVFISDLLESILFYLIEPMGINEIQFNDLLEFDFESFLKKEKERKNEDVMINPFFKLDLNEVKTRLASDIDNTYKRRLLYDFSIELFKMFSLSNIWVIFYKYLIRVKQKGFGMFNSFQNNFLAQLNNFTDIDLKFDNQLTEFVIQLDETTILEKILIPSFEILAKNYNNNELTEISHYIFENRKIFSNGIFRPLLRHMKLIDFQNLFLQRVNIKDLRDNVLIAHIELFLQNLPLESPEIYKFLAFLQSNATLSLNKKIRIIEYILDTNHLSLTEIVQFFKFYFKQNLIFNPLIMRTLIITYQKYGFNQSDSRDFSRFIQTFILAELLNCKFYKNEAFWTGFLKFLNIVRPYDKVLFSLCLPTHLLENIIQLGIISVDILYRYCKEETPVYLLKDFVVDEENNEEEEETESAQKEMEV